MPTEGEGVGKFEPHYFLTMGVHNHSVKQKKSDLAQKSYGITFGTRLITLNDVSIRRTTVCILGEDILCSLLNVTEASNKSVDLLTTILKNLERA